MGKFRTSITNSTGVLPILSTGTSTAVGQIYLDGNDDAVISPPSGKNLLLAVSGVLQLTLASNNLLFSPTNFNILANSVDGTDNKSLQLGGGGGASSSRGANIQLAGNEHASIGNLQLSAGDATGACTYINAPAANGEIRMFVAGSERWAFDEGGYLRFRGGTSMRIIGEDSTNRSVLLTPDSNGANAAYVSLNTDSGSGGHAYLMSGAATSAVTTIGTRSTSGTIDLQTNNTTRWQVVAGGDIVPFASGSYSIGSPSIPVRFGYFGDNSSQGLKLGWNITETASVISTLASSELQLHTLNSPRWRMTTAGHWFPYNDNTYDIGDSTHRVRNIYISCSVVGLDTKDSVRVATTANIDLATGTLLTIDGVTLIAGDRVLVKNQSTASQNGIYVAATGAWSRSTDAANTGQVNANMFVFVEEGTTLADTQWILTTNNPITVGSTSLVFTQFGGAAGSGLVNLNGLITTSQSFATGTTGSDFNISSGGSTHTFNIPDASGSARGLITIGSQTIAGTKTLTNDLLHSSSNFAIMSDTVDGSDNKVTTIAGGGGVGNTRGASIAVYGNEVGGNPGNVLINTGNDANSSIYLQTQNFVKFNINGVETVRADSNGFRYLKIPFYIYANTNDGTDTGILYLGGGGDIANNRGAYIAVAGNEHASLGKVTLQSGTVSGADIRLDVGSNANAYQLSIGNTPVQNISGTQQTFSIRDKTTSSLNHFTFTGNYGTITANGTVYQKVASFYGNDCPINVGIVESGYRIGLGIEHYFNTASFAGTLAEQTGIWCRTGDNTTNPTGTITNSYGLRVEHLQSGTVTYTNQPYGIYQYSNAGLGLTQFRNAFLGRVGIGTVTPNVNAGLDMRGKIYVNIGDNAIPTGTPGLIEVLNNGQSTPSLRITQIDPSNYSNHVVDLGSYQGASEIFNFIRVRTDVDGSPADRFVVSGSGRTYVGEDLVFFNHNTSSVIRKNTTDGSDTGRVEITGGGAIGSARGGYITLFGNEETSSASNPGRIDLAAGNVATGVINLYTQATQRWTLTTAGHWEPFVDATHDIGTSVSKRIRNLYSGGTVYMDNLGSAGGLAIAATVGSGSYRELRFSGTTNALITNTSDGADNAMLYLAGGGNNGLVVPGSSRGAFIQLAGNEHAGLGGIQIQTGTGTAGVGINLQVNNAVGEINFGTNSGVKWAIDAAGQLTSTIAGGGGRQIRLNNQSSEMYLCGGDGNNASANGAIIQLNGYTHATAAGAITLAPSNLATSHLTLLSNHASADITLSPNNPAGSRQTKFRGSDGAQVFTPTNHLIVADTTDGSDTKNITISGGGAGTATRGGLINLEGNESGGLGAVSIYGGNAGGSINLTDGAGNVWNFSSGQLQYSAATFIIRSNASDGSDTKSVAISGGGAASNSRGGYIQLYGNEASATGSISFVLGNNTGARAQVFLPSGTAFQCIKSDNTSIAFGVEEIGRIQHKAHTGYSGSGKFRFTKAINTTDATTTNLFTMGDLAAGLSDNTTYTFVVEIVGRLNSTTAKGIGGKLKFVVYRNNGGAAVIAADLGGRVKEIETYGTPGYDFDVDVSGNDVRIRVTGATSETVSWMGNIEWIAVSTSA